MMDRADGAMTRGARGEPGVNMKARSFCHRWRNILMFLLPSMIGFVLFMLIPTITAIGLSFTDYSGGFSANFLGLDNYYRACASAVFRGSVWVTVKFAVFTVLLQLLLGFTFALLLNSKIVGRNFYRAVIFLPVLLSQVAISLVFLLILHPSKGPVNSFLVSVGLAPQPWLASPKTALGTIIAVNIWQSFGYYMVLFLSGLQTINPDSIRGGYHRRHERLAEASSCDDPHGEPDHLSLLDPRHYQRFQGFRPGIRHDRRPVGRRAGGFDNGSRF